MNHEPDQTDPGGRIPAGARVVVVRQGRREAGTVIDNQGPADLVRFSDGLECWQDWASVERDNPGTPEQRPLA